MARAKAPDQSMPVRAGIIGLGAMGRGLLYQTLVTPAVACTCMAEIRLDAALPFLDSLGIEYRVVATAEALESAIEEGVLAVCEDGMLVSQCPHVDVVIEATNTVREGLAFARAALESGHHLVLMNAEIDLAFGPLLLKTALANGVRMTSCDGDQHGVIKHLVDDLRMWGFELVMGGNIKGFLDRRATPASILAEAEKRNLDARMCASYTDGTKLNAEMALLANALGMRTDIAGMHGPRARHVQEAMTLFDLERLHAEGTPVVDYVLGAQPDGGVFAIGRCSHPWQQGMLRYYKMGKGPFYLFYRPYHLCHVEAMQCVVDVSRGKSLLEPLAGFRTNVFARAKRALKAGEVLDGIGGEACYGLIENCTPGELPAGLPICLAEGLRVRRDVPIDEPLAIADVEVDLQRDDWRAYLDCYPTVPSSTLA